MLADPRREGASAPATPPPSASCPALKLGLVFSALEPVCPREGAAR